MRRTLAILAFAWASGLHAAEAPPRNFTSLWWNAAEPGWGLNLTHQGDVIFGTLFTYDAARNPLWLVMSDGRLQPGASGDPAAGIGDLGIYSGTLYRTKGPAFNASPFRPIGAGDITPVGEMRLAFGSRATTLEYDVDGAHVAKVITRQAFGEAPAACTTSIGPRSAFANFQDLWWNPDESGWGLNLTHQGNILFATLFTYGLDGKGLWLVMSNGQRQDDGSFTGDLYRTAGSVFNAVPFTPLAPADVTRVGTMTLRFANGETGTLQYTVDGVAVTKAITRQAFAASQSVCTSPTPRAVGFTDATRYDTTSNAALARAPETTSTSNHRITLGGVPIDYTATVGHLNTAGAEKASMFYAAYVREGVPAGSRPITFAYNGGPGNATLWLHIGGFGPKRVATGMPATTMPMPYALVDNAESLLDVTDLVFVDAVGTGYSEAMAPATNSTFYTVAKDAEVFNDFIARYVAVNDRRASPIYLMGESYGGIRAAKMAPALVSAGLRLAGLVLVSPILDYNANCEVATVPCSGQVAVYAAAASYHGLAAAAPRDEMRSFVRNEYEPAVQAFITAMTPPPSSVLDRLGATTGIARSVWEANPNRGSDYFRRFLVPGVLFGRYDSRVRLDRGSLPAVDPSLYLIEDSFNLRIGDYLTSLDFTSPVAYAMYASGGSFSFADGGRTQPDAVPNLAAALDANPRLKVFTLSGYYDLATPFLNTERDLARLGMRPTLRLSSYEGGHMTYLDDAARARIKADLARFYSE